MATKKKRPEVVLLPELCKGCGRCIDACPKDGIDFADTINQDSGLVPVHIDYDVCNHCGLCISACPEPFGIVNDGYQLDHPEALYGALHTGRPPAEAVAPTRIPLPPVEPLLLKGNYAAAVGALLAGCRHVYGYPITPSTEGAELMARLLPELDGFFVQAISEVATINHIYGCGAAGLPSMTFTSSPGFSLMLEGISYMIGAELPGVIINVMRPGPGLGFIGPEQSDIKMMCRGLGHGNTHAIVFAPSSPQQMLDHTMLAFELSFKYRNPVMVAADGYLGQITGRVNLPTQMTKPGLPSWAVYGDAAHRGNLVSSIFQDWAELERHNEKICDKYARIAANEQRANLVHTEDATTLVVACNIPARTAKAAVASLRRDGHKVGMFQPITLWPFPVDALVSLIDQLEHIVVVEASAGQLQDELRLALVDHDTRHIRFHHVRHMGGILPEEREVIAKVESLSEVAA